jgi:hypothetical protein
VSDLSSKPVYEEALDKLWLINRSTKGQQQKKVDFNGEFKLGTYF